MRKLLFAGGPILTMDNTCQAEALLVEGRHILALGRYRELMAQAPDAKMVHLGGCTLMPGFIDAHSHFSQVASGLLQADLDGAVTDEAFAARIAAHIAEARIRPGEWVIARNYDNNLLPGAAHLTLAQLDSFCPAHPLLIQHKSGHMGLFNSRALAALGVTPDTPVPAGGRLGLENGALTGYMEENIFFEYLKRVPQPDMTSLRDAYGRAAELYASYGITTIQEGMMVREMLPLYRMLAEEGMPMQDLVVYPEPAALEETLAQMAQFPPNMGQGAMRVGGIKIFLDGSPQGRTAWMRQPYAGEAEYRGYPTMDDDAVCDAFALAARHGLQLLAHCNGDAAAEQFLRCLARAEQAWPQLKTLRPVIIHGQLMGRDQLAQARELGAMVSFFGAHVYHWGDTHIRNFGPARASAISPAASARAAGVPFTFHQDAPVIRPDMMETVWCAAARTTKGGVHLGPEEAISVQDALEAVTVTAAWQYGEENRKGRLAPGMLADLTILRGDPCTAPLDQLRGMRVARTYKEGNLIYQRDFYDET